MARLKKVSPRRLARSEGNGCRAVAFDRLDGILPEFRLIVNTVPAAVLGAERLRLLRKNALVIDLASAPGGDDSGDNLRIPTIPTDADPINSGLSQERKSEKRGCGE